MRWICELDDPGGKKRDKDSGCHMWGGIVGSRLVEGCVDLPVIRNGKKGSGSMDYRIVPPGVFNLAGAAGSWVLF